MTKKCEIKITFSVSASLCLCKNLLNFFPFPLVLFLSPFTAFSPISLFSPYILFGFYVRGNRQCKFVPVHTFRAYKLSGELAPHILNLGTRCLGRFIPWIEPRYPLNMRLGGPQTWSECFGKKKNFLPLLQFEPRTVHPEVKPFLKICYSKHLK